MLVISMEMMVGIAIFGITRCTGILSIMSDRVALAFGEAGMAVISFRAIISLYNSV